MTSKQRAYLIEIVAGMNYDENPIKWPLERTRRDLKGFIDEDLLEMYGYLLEENELESVQ